MNRVLDFAPPAPEKETTRNPYHETLERIVTINVQMSIQSTDQNTLNVFSAFSTLTTQLLSTGDAIILPFDDDSTHTPITTLNDVPPVPESLKAFCHDAHPNPRGSALLFLIKIKTQDATFTDIKNKMYNYLMEQKVWLRPTRLLTSHNCVIGWLKYSHTKMCSRFSLEQSLRETCSVTEPFQLISRGLHTEYRTTKTTALAIECANVNARAIASKIMRGMQEDNPNTQYAPTRHMFFVPIRANDYITPETLDRCIQAQYISNETLRRVTVNNADHLTQTCFANQ